MTQAPRGRGVRWGRVYTRFQAGSADSSCGSGFLRDPGKASPSRPRHHCSASSILLLGRLGVVCVRARVDVWARTDMHGPPCTRAPLLTGRGGDRSHGRPRCCQACPTAAARSPTRRMGSEGRGAGRPPKSRSSWCASSPGSKHSGPRLSCSCKALSPDAGDLGFGPQPGVWRLEIYIFGG